MKKKLLTIGIFLFYPTYLTAADINITSTVNSGQVFSENNQAVNISGSNGLLYVDYDAAPARKL